ncbi:MAG TPA: GAF domain-containing protein [Terriglobales bacterium]
MSSRIPSHQVHFLSLSTAIFCVQCELISANNTTCCLACGSKAVLSLSRLLGGSLRGQSTARVIHDDELNQLVRQLLHTVPGSECDRDPVHHANLPARHHARVHDDADTAHTPCTPVPQINLEPAIGVIAERAQVLTGATGAALALRNGSEVICRARAGRTAPDLGVRLQTDSGVSAECLRTGEVVLCNNAEDHPHVDRFTCERLGVRSILAAPLRQFHSTLGIFEVLSAVPNAFNHQDIATMQLLSSMMVTAITRLSRMTPRSIWR